MFYYWVFKIIKLIESDSLKFINPDYNLVQVWCKACKKKYMHNTNADANSSIWQVFVLLKNAVFFANFLSLTVSFIHMPSEYLSLRELTSLDAMLHSSFPHMSRFIATRGIQCCMWYTYQLLRHVLITEYNWERKHICFYRPHPKWS